MANNVYYDTNILLDLMDSSRPFAKGSLKITRELITDGSLLYLNSDSVTNTFYILSRTKRYRTAGILKFMKKTISLFTVVAIENKEVMAALSLCEESNTSFKDYEDALQYICARKIDAKMIVTNDKGFIGGDIEVIVTGI